MNSPTRPRPGRGEATDWRHRARSAHRPFRLRPLGRTAYVFGVVLLAIVFVLLRLVVRSPFGMLCRGIKEDPIRIRAMGASPTIAILKMYVISGAVAGVGGALNAVSTQVVGLDSLSFTLSAESLVMLVLGGTGSLFGRLPARSSSCSSKISSRRPTRSIG